MPWIHLTFWTHVYVKCILYLPWILMAPLFTPFLLSIMAAPWPQLLSAPLRLPWNIHYTMNDVQTAGRAAPVYPAPRSQLPKSLFTLILRWAFGLHAVSPHALLAPHTCVLFCCTILAMIFHLIWANYIFFLSWVLTWRKEKNPQSWWLRTSWHIFAFSKAKAFVPDVLCTCSSFCVLCRNFAKEVPKELIIRCILCTTSKKKVMKSFLLVKCNFVYFPAD